MRGWTDCPRCAGTGSGEDGGGCGYAPTTAEARGLEVRAVDGQFVAEPAKLPPCPYGSDELHERGRILAVHYWDTGWEGTMFRGVRAVLVSGGIGDYAVYLGVGSVEWARECGAKLSFEVAKAVFPRIDERRYRH